MNNLELRIPPLAVFVVFIAAITAAGVYIPAANIAFPGHRVFAVIFFILGWSIVGAGVFEFRRAKTTMNPMSPERAVSIVSSGVYRLSRNPMYLGMALVLVGAAAWWSSLLGYAATALFCAYMTRFQIAPEERALLKIFGSEFSAYKARVRRWI
jgi:protein-S-isoprenylcysteine O-methyltransferase Ste14